MPAWKILYSDCIKYYIILKKRLKGLAGWLTEDSWCINATLPSSGHSATLQQAKTEKHLLFCRFYCSRKNNDSEG